MSTSAFARAVGAAAAGRRKKPPKGNPFTPYVAPTRPPSGLYDPALDSQEAAATRGYQDLTADTGTANTRSSDDFVLAQNRINQQAGNSLADLLLNRQRGTQDYNTATGERTRQYGILAGNQAQASNAAGDLSGGALAQGAQKRTANQGREQGFADQAYQRFLTGSTTGETRLHDSQSQSLADLALGYNRGSEDRTTALTRAGRENVFFGADIGKQRFWQATGTGWEPDTKPSNEGTRSGVTYHRLGGGKFKLADGTIVSHDDLLRRIKQAQAAGGH